MRVSHTPGYNAMVYNIAMLLDSDTDESDGDAVISQLKYWCVERDIMKQHKKGVTKKKTNWKYRKKMRIWDSVSVEEKKQKNQILKFSLGANEYIF